MKKQKNKQVVSLDDFDNTISLWQLLPSGVGSGLKRLKIIIDSIQNSQVEQSLKPLSLLLVGKQGLRTHGRAVIRALGLEYPCETPAHFLQSTQTEIYNYFNPTRLCDSYIISSVSLLYTPTLKVLHEIISSGRYSVFNNVRKATELIPVHYPVIMTTKNKKNIPEYFLEKIDHVVEIGDYTDQQLELIVLQRLKYSQVDYQEEKVLWLVKEYGIKNLNDIIRLLKDAITIMLAEGRTVLTVEDVKKVMSLS